MNLIIDNTCSTPVLFPLSPEKGKADRVTHHESRTTEKSRSATGGMVHCCCFDGDDKGEGDVL